MTFKLDKTYLEDTETLSILDRYPVTALHLPVVEKSGKAVAEVIVVVDSTGNSKQDEALARRIARGLKLSP